MGAYSGSHFVENRDLLSEMLDIKDRVEDLALLCMLLAWVRLLFRSVLSVPACNIPMTDKRPSPRPILFSLQT